MNITYSKAGTQDIEPLQNLCRKLIYDYEDTSSINLEKAVSWTDHKIETCIHEYSIIYADGQKAGYLHFFRNEDGMYEIDDLYVFPAFQSKGIGTAVIRSCLDAVNKPVMLYVFIRNERAVSLYRRLGFEIRQSIHNSRYIMVNDNKKTSSA